MSANERPVTTDALETLGTIIGPNEKRDAIHLAVFPAVAAHALFPGDDVGFQDDGTAGECEDQTKLVGIVDPFLKAKVKKGERFWLIVYPRQITSLRHVWSHPAFDSEPVADRSEPASGDTPEVARSKQWLASYAMTLGVSYEDLIEHAEEYVNTGSYWNQGDRFEGEYVGEDFWRHYEMATGKKSGDRGSFFSCSC